MVSTALVSRIVGSTWFAVGWAPYLLLDTDLRIVGVNQAYASVTGHPRDQLLDHQLFDVFPDNPADPGADGVANLSGSLHRVLTSGQRHWMGFQRYDVPDLREPGTFVFKVWTPVNAPITHRGRLVALLHHVQDVTPALRRPNRPVVTASSRPDIEAAADLLGREFPQVPFDAVIGVLTHSHRIVLETIGTPDPARAAELARLRLEIRTGQPASRPEA